MRAECKVRFLEGGRDALKQKTWHLESVKATSMALTLVNIRESGMGGRP
jgi:hypothetical protein